MRKLQIILIILFMFALGVLVVTILFHYGVLVKAQEGCGQWVKVEFIGHSERGRGYIFDYSGYEKVDSVWVPWECAPDISSGAWYLQFKTPEPCSLTIKIRLDTLWYICDSVWVADYFLEGVRNSTLDQSTILDAPIDTYYLDSRQRWRWEEELKQEQCEEIWDCVMKKLAEFLEEERR